MRVPSLILRQLYSFGSLENTADGVRFALKNRLSDATLTAIDRVMIGKEVIRPEKIRVELEGGQPLSAVSITPDQPLDFPLKQSIRLVVDTAALDRGKHDIRIECRTEPFGKLKIKVSDALSAERAHGNASRRSGVPYDKRNDYTPDLVARRQSYVREFSGASFEHLQNFSFDPAKVAGNVENFTGVAQVPIGFAGPLHVKGEHADGEFLIPLATTEGTLVASYNRGMKCLNLAGGVTCTVIGDYMQRAPVFIFDSAREARDFKSWVDDNFDLIRKVAEETSSVAQLVYIDTYLANKFAFLRFNYTTGDAAGQNMVGRATFAACSFILEQSDSVRRFFLESNLATDKKASQVNVMRTRGKRVVAEATIPRDVLIESMRVEPEALAYHYGVAGIGAFLSGAHNNGLHSPNGITAMFIATGQDVANVSESSAGILYVELTPEKDLHISLTIPSLIVATHGGGTGLPTQSECLEILGCKGRDTVRKFAEIVAGVALAGEISLASAISSMDWVSSHERYGRNR